MAKSDDLPDVEFAHLFTPMSQRLDLVGATGPVYDPVRVAVDILRDGLEKAVRASQKADDPYSYSQAYGSLSGTVAAALAALGVPVDLAALNEGDGG